MARAVAPGGRRAGVLALWLAALALGVLQIVRTPFVADLSAFLPASPDATQRALIEQVTSGVPARTLLIGIDGGTAAQRADASRALAARLVKSGLFEQVHNGDRAAWADAARWLHEHRYVLSPALDPQRFTSSGLRDAIDDTVALLGTPAGAAVKPLLASDPTGETQRIAEALIPVGAPRVEAGVWASRKLPRALLTATTRAAGADLDAQQRAIAAVRGAFAEVAAPGLELRLAGAPVFAVTSRALVEHEVRWLGIAGAVAMVVLLFASFGSLGAVAIAALPVASGIVAGIVAVGLAFGHVHGVTLGFGSTLIGEAVDYGVYYLVQARHGGWQAWLRHGWPTVRLGLATSVCGFAALLFSGFPGLAQLGLYTLAGLAAAAATTRWVLPALRPEGTAAAGLRAPLGRAAQRGLALAPRLRVPLLALGAAALVLLALQRPPLWRGDLVALSPLPAELIALDTSLRAELAASDARTLVVVQGASSEAALQRAEAAAARLEALVGRGVIAGYDSATKLLPSLATQRARRAALPERAALEAALAEATRGGPLPAARLAPFVDAVERARAAPPLAPEQLRGTALAGIVDALLLRRADGSAAALLPLQPPPQGDVDREALRAALAGLDGVQVLDLKAELDRLYARYVEQAQLLALLGAAAVVALVAARLRSLRRVAAVTLPLALAVVLVLAALVLLDVRLGILHLVGLLLVVAVGSNYTLFYDLLRAPATPGDADTLASLVLANATTVVSFGLIALSAIPALSAIGSVVAPGALLALLVGAAFAPRRAEAPANAV